jgi:hypothetical protein
VKFYKNADIERIAEEKLAEFSRLLGGTLPIPVPIDLFAEKVCRLNILWDSIDEHVGETIFGGLSAEDRLIVLNENRRSTFEERPGLERSTIGHEIGHWELFTDKTSIGQPALPGFTRPESFVRRTSNKRSVEIIKALIRTEEGREALRELNARADHPDEARAVNRFAAAISMPQNLIRAEASKVDRTDWKNLYPLAQKFGVTITALKVRLQQLGLLHVTEDGKLYASPDAAHGQMQLLME